MMHDLLKSSEAWTRKVADLRKKSSYYPEILYEAEEETDIFHPQNKRLNIFHSTLVRIKRDGKWFLVHVVESCFLDYSNGQNSKLIIKATLSRFCQAIEMVKLFYIVDESTEIDALQIEEIDRLNPIKNL